MARGERRLRQASQDSLSRIQEVIHGLKSFAALDEAEVRRVDLHEDLESTLVLIEQLLGSEIEVVKSFGTIPEISVRVEISEPGRGMSEEAMAEIFEPAFDSTSTRVKAGFGLFVRANIVRRHGGEILVESEVGKGSKFTVVLPLRPSA